MQHSKFLSMLAVLALVTSAFSGGAFAATASIDTTNDADSSTTSDLTDGTTIAGFTANASNSTYVEVSFDTALDGEAKLEFVDPDTADTVSDMEVVYANSSATEVNATSYNYAWNITHDELADLPVDYGENKTFTVRVLDTQDETNATTIDVHINNTGDRAVYRVGNSFTDSDVDVEEAHPRLSYISSSYDGDEASFEIDDVATTPNTTHTVTLDNTTVSDAFSLAAEDKDDGAWMPAMWVKVEGDDEDFYAPVFVNEQNEDWDFLDSDEAYAVYDTSSDSVEIVGNGDERLDGADTTTFTLAGNDGLSIGQNYDMFQGLGAGQVDSVSKAVGGYTSAAV